MAYEMQKRLSRCNVIEHQPLTLACLFQRAYMEESGQCVPYDPRIVDDLFAPFMGKRRRKPARGAGEGKNPAKKVRQ